MIITGAASGIGAAAAEELRVRGARVVGLDVNATGLAPDEKALTVLDVNLIGPWRVTAAALPALRESPTA